MLAVVARSAVAVAAIVLSLKRGTMLHYANVGTQYVVAAEIVADKCRCSQRFKKQKQLPRSAGAGCR